MDTTEAINNLSVCGLDCSRCADYENGEIRNLSAKLSDLLKGYERLAKMKAENTPNFKGYPEFVSILNHFAKCTCSGCKSENIQCPLDCHAKTCRKERNINFCFECDEFPCADQFEGKLRERWIQRNNKMKEIGVENYYIEQGKLPRY
ncbi:hypothetical protein Desaci_1420 [Desulfosporosinus acidiphilus SJ4]|uniref:DUF3795 domain-containing protein n=1 Tax=Desulfosporosinus acidiphilus (strain DSM 22704 / JCM 16185 / SJ4) TaxID=646529 RepID=I4D3R5_DESAJ|nr:DUF3795 domain-containing protein [Desulfosporosinus acidiphilus]AFM40439.1 hypothetical protein Desaci_1420 [Desulfosporosinus acidiphilus SJ4]